MKFQRIFKIISLYCILLIIRTEEKKITHNQNSDDHSHYLILDMYYVVVPKKT